MKILILLASLALVCSSLDITKANTILAHTGLVSSIALFNDNQRVVTGGADNIAKVWSLTNYTMIHNFGVFPDTINDIELHPVDNRIFILLFNGDIRVYHGTTYALIRTDTHPNAGTTGFAYYVVFDAVNNKHYISGYDGTGGIAPVVYVYNSTTYAQITSFPTTFPANEATYQMALNPGNSHLALINEGLAAPYELEVYSVPGNTLISKFSAASGKYRWVHFSLSGNYLCASHNNNVVKCYSYNVGTNQYQLDRTIGASLLGPGAVYGLSFGVPNGLAVTVGSKIVFYDFGSRALSATYEDVDNIYLLRNTPGMEIVVTGTQTGKLSIWRKLPELEVAGGPNIPLIVGLSVGIPCFIILVGVLVYCCLFGGCRKKVGEEAEEKDESKLKQETMNEQSYVNVHKSSIYPALYNQISFDKVYAKGCILVISDHDKKKSLLTKLDNQLSQKKQDPSILKPLQVATTIIVIREDGYIDDQDLTYEQLMAQGTVIVIKDDDVKKEYLEHRKKLGRSQNNKQLLAEMCIIVIKDEDEKKDYIDFTKNKKNEYQQPNIAKQIKHDKAYAQGSILLIADKDKKKQLVTDLNSELKHKKQDPSILKPLEVATTIIVIKEDADLDDENLTYEQLMAQGTVIVIKDDDVKKDYLQHRKKSGKPQGNNKQMMAQMCIIVIKDEDEKKDYLQFVKGRKDEKSSNMDYNQLMNGGNVMNIAEPGAQPGKPSHLIAEKNYVAIQESTKK